MAQAESPAVDQPEKPPAFFGTLFSSATSLEIRHGLEKFGAHKAGKIEMGGRLLSAPYFHFVVPKDQVEPVLHFLNDSGTLLLDGSQDPLALETPEVRFVVWLAPLSRLAKVGPKTLLIQRVVPDPETAREQMRTYLKSNNFRFSGNLYLDVKIRKFSGYVQLMKYVQEQGSLFVKQTIDWDKKSLRFSFSSQKPDRSQKRAQLVFTPARNLSKEDWQKFETSVWSQRPDAGELPAFYLEVIKYGDLSIYPGRPGEEIDRRISQSVRRAPEEKIKTPQEVTDTMVDVGDGLYLETTIEKLTSYLDRPTVRGYYLGNQNLYAADEKVLLRQGFFEIQVPEADVRAETRLRLGEDPQKIRLSFIAEKIPSYDLTISGSFIKKSIGETSVLTWIHGDHWFERPFGVARISPYFQNVGLRADYIQMTNFLEQKAFVMAGAEMNARFLHDIHTSENGLVVGLGVDSLASGDFQGSLMGLKISYETELPFPLFEDWPKSIEADIKVHLWGPSVSVSKSVVYGLRGKMRISPNFYLHGGIQKFESDIKNTDLQQEFAANILLVDGGFGFKF